MPKPYFPSTFILVIQNETLPITLPVMINNTTGLNLILTTATPRDNSVNNANLRVENYSSNYYLKIHLNIETSNEYVFYNVLSKKTLPFCHNQ